MCVWRAQLDGSQTKATGLRACQCHSLLTSDLSAAAEVPSTRPLGPPSESDAMPSSETLTPEFPRYQTSVYLVPEANRPLRLRLPDQASKHIPRGYPVVVTRPYLSCQLALPVQSRNSGAVFGDKSLSNVTIGFGLDFWRSGAERERERGVWRRWPACLVSVRKGPR